VPAGSNPSSRNCPRRRADRKKDDRCPGYPPELLAPGATRGPPLPAEFLPVYLVKSTSGDKGASARMSRQQTSPWTLSLWWFQVVETGVDTAQKFRLQEREDAMGRGGIIWTVVGILLIIALLIYIL
jgi:hypothetical protein